MFSRRSSWDLGANRLARAVEERKRRKEPVIDLTLSNPTQSEIDYPEEIQQVLARAEIFPYQPEPLGLPGAREAVRAYYATRGVELDPGQILLTASTSEAYGFLFKLLADPEDSVLVPRPSYPLFEFLARLDSVRIRTYPIRFAGQWRIDLDRMAAQVDERTRAVVLVHPNNPTGSFVKPEERAEIEALAEECGISLIVDEVFADYVLEDGARRVPSFAQDASVPTFVLGGLSKLLGLPQVKLSWIGIAGPEEERRKALARLEIIADTYLSVGTSIQQALPGLMEIRSKVQARIRDRIRKNLAYLRNRIQEVEGPKLLPCEGGWYSVLEIEGDGEDVALELLEGEGVLVHPGYFFDFPHGGFLVLSLLPQQFEEGVERLVRKVEG